MKGITKYILALFLCVGVRAFAQQERPYLCEMGLQAGIGYYVGDATPHIFMHPREAYGIHFRYKFDRRWAIRAKLSGQRIKGHTVPFENRLYNIDVVGEFNFLRFGSAKNYDTRIKPYTPYIFLGIGTGINWADDQIGKSAPRWSSVYIPLGIGFKWKFAERCGLNIAWQHNIYCGDGLEGKDELDNTNKLNGWNIMNMDVSGMFTVGIVVEFNQQKAPCRFCNE